VSKHWAPEELEKMARLLIDGLSATEIARWFGVTRNVIIGVVRRGKERFGAGFKRKGQGGHAVAQRAWTEADRANVAEMMRAGKSIADVARFFGISSSTVEKRVYRNRSLAAIGFHSVRSVTPPHMMRSWNDTDRADVAELLRAGKSAGEIAAKWRLTRNAVIGRVSRDKMLSEIGLRGGQGGGARIKQSRYPGVMSDPKRKPANAVNTLMVAMAREGRPAERVRPAAPTKFACRSVPLMDLNRGDCKWPVNNAARGEMHLFCGIPADGPYCAAHHRRSVDRRSAMNPLSGRE
jgi:hypothetical protein